MLYVLYFYIINDGFIQFVTYFQLIYLILLHHLFKLHFQQLTLLICQIHIFDLSIFCLNTIPRLSKHSVALKYKMPLRFRSFFHDSTNQKQESTCQQDQILRTQVVSVWAKHSATLSPKLKFCQTLIFGRNSLKPNLWLNTNINIQIKMSKT